MFVNNEDMHRTYRGYNPAFVRRVREKREQARQMALIQAKEHARRERSTYSENLAREKDERSIAKAEANEAITVLVSERDKKLALLASMEVITPKDFAARLAARHGFLWDEIISDGRGQPLVRVRHAVILAVIEAYPALSYPKVGHLFRRDHSSILHVVRKAARGKAA